MTTIIQNSDCNGKSNMETRTLYSAFQKQSCHRASRNSHYSKNSECDCMTHPLFSQQMNGTKGTVSNSSSSTYLLRWFLHTYPELLLIWPPGKFCQDAMDACTRNKIPFHIFHFHRQNGCPHSQKCSQVCRNMDNQGKDRSVHSAHMLEIFEDKILDISRIVPQ